MNGLFRRFLAPVLCLLGLLGLLAIASAYAQETAVARPAITGIARVQILVTNAAKSEDFYEKTLRFHLLQSGCDSKFAACLIINDHQQIQLAAVSDQAPPSLLAEIIFATADAAQMRRYLISKGLSPDPVVVDVDHTQHFTLLDPDGHYIGFIQLPKPAGANAGSSGQPSTQLIHAGFIIRDRAAEDHLYKDILGFRVYWHGGRKDSGETDWLDMQVPEGTQWLEYMLNVSPDANHQTLGVMNHIALGVADIQTANQQLQKNGWKPGEAPKLGRDGKWQLNLYDPDETRIEFMEFKPTQEPCCSPYTGPHPGPNP